MARNRDETPEEEGYDDLLNRSWDEIPETSILPNGRYLLKFRSNGKYTPASDTGNARVGFMLSVVEPVEVDEDAIAELGSDYDFGNNDVFHTVWIERAKDWQGVRTLLTAAGVDMDGVSIQDSLKGVRGKLIAADLGVNSYVSKRTGQQVTENVILTAYAIED